MENHFKELSQLIKLPNDSNIQLKVINILNDILENLKKFEKKKLTDSQPTIEESLYCIISSNRANSDICNRYIYYIYKHLFDNGHSSRLSEFIIKYLALVNNNKTNQNIKATSLWLLGKVCSKSVYKSPQLTDFLQNLIKIIKNTNEIFIKSECFGSLSRLLMLKLPNFYNQIGDILKIILKQEKYSITDIKCRKNILKAMDSLIFYLNPTMINQNHDGIISFLNKNLDEEESIVQKHAIKIFVDLHTDKIFDSNINITRIMRKKMGEQLKNFIEVLLYIGGYIISKNETSYNLKISYINIMKILFEKNKDFLNSNENIIPKIFNILYENFKLNYSGFISNFSLNYKQNAINNSNFQNNSETLYWQNKLNNEIEELFRFFIKLIFHSSLRKTLLKHIFKKINEAQGELDKMENSSLNFGGFNRKPIEVSGGKDKNKKKEIPEIKNEKFNQAQVNSIIFSLIEYAENNYDIFEIVFKNFNEISQALVPYLISPVKSFRMLVNRVFINLAYFIPGWRITILTLILNFSSVAHAEVAALKNTFIYSIDESNPEFKYSLIIRNNLELLKDIANCLAIILTTFSHTHKGVTIDMSNAALSIAKNMIIGKFADEDDNPKSLSVLEKAAKFNYSNSDVDAHKEAGWIIIEGLSSMDYTWQTYNFKSLNLLWKYIFSENCCKIEEEHLSKPEYKEALIGEFYIKKAALSSLRKFILSSKDFRNSPNFQNTIPKLLSNAIDFFIPNDQKKTLFFFKTILKEKYKEVKIILYNCLALIKPKLYVAKFNHVLHFLCEEIISSEYTDFSLDYIYLNINFFDSFMCEKYNEKKYTNLMNSNNYYIIDLYNIDNFDISQTDKLNAEINSKLVNSAINLLVEILLDNSFYAKNRHSILKYFLTQMSEISIKQIDYIKKNKALNIIFCLYFILKKSHEKKIFIINDESLFASSKMIFDIGFKIENSLIRRISAEGHSYLIKVSSNPQYNLNYYLTALECKFKNETNLDNNHFISTFYMIANMFRISEFSDIIPILDNYMNFIISYFNKIEDLFNPYISQSILIITEVLIANNKIDHARKMIEVYKLNYLFINRDNNVYFKDTIERNSLAEIKLILMIGLLNENIKSSEIDLFKLILNKFILDEKYKSPKIKKAFLYLAKIIISNKKIKDFIHSQNFINFLCDNINESNNIMQTITNQSNKIFTLNLIQRFSIEILITYLLKSEKEDQSLKIFAEKLIITLNAEYSSNNLFHYNNLIFKQIFNVPSTKQIIFDKYNYQDLIDINNFVNIHNNTNLILYNNSDKNAEIILFSTIYPKYHLIRLYKLFLKIYFEKRYNQTLFLINMIKDIIQNQLLLYSNSSLSGKGDPNKLDALTKSEETKDDLIKNLPLLFVRNLNIVMHVNTKIFLIKSLTNCLKITLFNISKISTGSNVNNSNTQKYLEFLNYFMSISMVLILSEECWDIKVNGVNLLLEIIKRFSKIKDDRIDDNSLLIQQYEAQISSCIKMIFGNNFSIESLFKGMDLLYCYICIPITTDNNYIKKIDTFIDIDLHKNNPGTIFSEKYDHFFITKKLKFFCKLYMSSLLSNNKKNILNSSYRNISVFNSKVSDLVIYGESLEKTEHLYEYFDINLGKLFKNIFDMLNDFNIILNSDPKFAKNYKNYEFLASGNRIAYSFKKVHKYSQIYLRILSFILIDKRFKKEALDSLQLKFDELKFDNICELILHHINHFSVKNSQNSELNVLSISDFNMYSDSDITFELKEKLILNSIKIVDLMEILYQILSSEVKISKKIFMNILNLCFYLINFSIVEFEEKIFNILESLLKRLINSNEFICIINESEEKIFNFSEEEKKNLQKSLVKFSYNCFSKNEITIFSEKNISSIGKLLEIVDFTANYILTQINFIDNKFDFIDNEKNKNLLNDFLILVKIQFEIFKKTQSQQISKICAAKLFHLLSSIRNLKILKLFYDLIFINLNEITQFDRYFILYYMILQNLSKKNNISKKDEADINQENNEIINFSFFILLDNFKNKINSENFTRKNDENKDTILFIIKSLNLACQNNFDILFKNFFENILYYSLEENLFLNLIIYEEFQNLILSFTLTIEEDEKRKNLIVILLYLLNEKSINSGNEINRLGLIALKLLTKDLEVIGGIAGNLDRNFLTVINNLANMQRSQMQNANKPVEIKQDVKGSGKNQIINEKISDKDENENVSMKNENVQINNEEGSKKSTGPKLKALKFGKN